MYFFDIVLNSVSDTVIHCVPKGGKYVLLFEPNPNLLTSYKLYVVDKGFSEDIYINSSSIIDLKNDDIIMFKQRAYENGDILKPIPYGEFKFETSIKLLMIN